MLSSLVIVGLLLVVIGQAWLWMVREFSTPGKHALRGMVAHPGWEGREDELAEFTARFLIDKHTAPRWPTHDMDTQEFPAIRVGVNR